MNINRLTTQQKSVMLGKLMGWIRPAGEGYRPGLWVIDTGHGHVFDGHFWTVEPKSLSFFDLYTSEMGMVWHVVNWAMRQNSPLHSKDSAETADLLSGLHYVIRQSVDKDHDEAQAAWLDKILSLAIEAGLVESQP